MPVSARSPVPDPAQLQRFDVVHAGRVAQCCFGGVDQFGVDGVHEPAVDVAGGAAQHDQDGDRDEDADEGVGQREPGQYAEGAGDDGE